MSHSPITTCYITFLGAKAPLGIVSVSESVTHEKVLNQVYLVYQVYQMYTMFQVYQMDQVYQIMSSVSRDIKCIKLVIQSYEIICGKRQWNKELQLCLSPP